jgi:hypothetical protein
VPSTPESSISDAELIALLRKRLHDLEEAAENYIEVVTETGERRMAAMVQLQAALSSDFKTAILCSHGMTPEQRAHWLAKIAEDDAARPATAAEGGEGGHP